MNLQRVSDISVKTTYSYRFLFIFDIYFRHNREMHLFRSDMDSMTSVTPS